jgi:hypothetical protein
MQLLDEQKIRPHYQNRNDIDTIILYVLYAFFYFRTLNELQLQYQELKKLLLS